MNFPYADCLGVKFCHQVGNWHMPIFDCRRCGALCSSARHRTHHESICTGLPGYSLFDQPQSQTCNGNNEAPGGADAPQGASASGSTNFDGWVSDNSDESSSSDESQTEQKAEHAAQLVAKSQQYFEAYGNDKCTFDVANFIIRRSLGVRGGTELMQLVDQYGINFGRGLHHSCNSYLKLNNVLDADPSLPFTKHSVSSSMFPGVEHDVYTRDLLSVIKHMWHNKDFNGHIHVRPCRERTEDGKRVTVSSSSGLGSGF